MSPSINWGSIIAKAQERMSKSDMQKRVGAHVDNIVLNFVASPKGTVVNPRRAAQKFIEVLQAEVQSCAGMSAADGGLGDTAVAALTQLTHGEPQKVGFNRYQISVSFKGKLERDSLDPSYFDGVDNIAAVLNKGYSAKHTVYGTWPGHGYADVFNMPSLRERAGAHFIESAIRSYMANYAHEYGVVDIEVDEVYK